MPRLTHKSAGDQSRRKATAAKPRGSKKAQAMAERAEPVPDAPMEALESSSHDTATEDGTPLAGALMLPDCLDSAAAADLKDMFLARRGNAILVDARQVRRVGVQSLQVLVAAVRTWRSDGLEFRLENPSTQMIETIALVGLPREDLQIEGMQQ